MARQPWHVNLGKRQIKSPKVYFRDSGILHHLLGIHTNHDLLLHPKVGASWEGYAVEEVINAVASDPAQLGLGRADSSIAWRNCCIACCTA